MESIKSMIEKVRELNNLSHDEFSDSLGITSQQLMSYYDDEILPKDFIKKLTKTYDLTHEYVIVLKRLNRVRAKKVKTPN